MPNARNVKKADSNQATDYIESGYNKGTIRSDIWYLVVSKDVRRHRLISISYISHGRCHGRGREFESRRPRHFSPNIVVPFLRNAQGGLRALARLYTTRGKLCSYTRQPTTKAPSSLNRNPGYPPRFLSVQAPGANDSLVDQLLSLRL